MIDLCGGRRSGLGRGSNFLHKRGRNTISDESVQCQRGALALKGKISETPLATRTNKPEKRQIIAGYVVALIHEVLVCREVARLRIKGVEGPTAISLTLDCCEGKD